jgi:hypothetical protein
MSRNRQALNILWLTLLLAASFALLVHLTSWRAELAETNFQHNVIRLQNFLFDAPPRAVLVGSSLSGRLLMSYFDTTPLAPVANLGLDSSGPVFGLDVVLKRPPPVVLIEENLLLNPTNHNEDLMVDAMQSFHFRSARYLPLLRADSRPSSLLYTWAKLRRAPAADLSPGLPPKPSPTNVPAVLTPASSSPAGNSVAREKLRVQIKILQDRGCRILLVRLPTSSQFSSRDNPNLLLGDELKREFNLVRIDLEPECARRGYVMKYSDGYHLAPQAARQAAKIIADLVGRESGR